MTRHKSGLAILVFLGLFVIMLGAYTRLNDAGLGCPDWPGCYGKLVLPNSTPALQHAQQAFPTSPLVAHKAWTEMVHRYFAGSLGILILLLAAWSTLRRRPPYQQSVLVPWVLVLLVIFQALLGMWTVTLKLLPLVVMGHLIGGMTLVALLWWLMLASRHTPPLLSRNAYAAKPWAMLGLIIVLLQIALGAWTSTNYAALACPHFPFCHNNFAHPMDWRAAFNFAHPIGPNYEGASHLAMNARAAIQMAHRYGALVVVTYFLPFALFLIAAPRFSPLRHLGGWILLLLGIQVALGISNVVLTLPMWTAVTHTCVAALLLLTLVTVLYNLSAKQGGFYRD